MCVHSPLMEVEDEDGANHTAGDHHLQHSKSAKIINNVVKTVLSHVKIRFHHDTGEVGAYKRGVAARRLHS